MQKGGGGVKLFAAIDATYPIGSNCICTNGTKTLIAKGNGGHWIFSIPEDGEWTLTATDKTDPSKTKSQSVSITTEGQWESVELKYRTYIYEQGVTEIVFASSAGDRQPDDVDETVWQATSHTSLKQVNGVLVDDDVTTSTNHRINRAKRVDLTDIDTIFFELRYIDEDGYTGSCVGVSNSWPYWSDFSLAAKALLENNTNKQTLALDVSSLSGEYWIVVMFASLKGHELYNIWY